MLQFQNDNNQNDHNQSDHKVAMSGLNSQLALEYLTRGATDSTLSILITLLWNRKQNPTKELRHQKQDVVVAFGHSG